MTTKHRQFQIEVTDGMDARYSATLICEVLYSTEGGFSKRDCSIVMRVAGKEFSGMDRDLFEAFCRVREQLESQGLVPLCYGASRNVVPSGMLRDMATGLRAYRLVMGQHTRSSDTVHIFDSGPDLDPVTVRLQHEFHARY